MKKVNENQEQSNPSRIDELIQTLLPQMELPPHLSPAQLLDEEVEIPAGALSIQVEALRELIHLGGKEHKILGHFFKSQSIAEFFRTKLMNRRLESFWVMGLDMYHQGRFVLEIAKGPHVLQVLKPYDVMYPLMVNANPYGVLIHNHPHGKSSPTLEDITFTERMTYAFRLMGIQLLDHLIVSREGCTSLSDQGFLEQSTSSLNA